LNCSFSSPNVHSRKLGNHKARVALWVAWYNFVRVNTSVKITPCMAVTIAWYGFNKNAGTQ
jgi:hypothetical protein